MDGNEGKWREIDGSGGKLTEWKVENVIKCKWMKVNGNKWKINENGWSKWIWMKMNWSGWKKNES